MADEEEEEESDSERVRMKTPHLPLKSLKVSSSQPTSSSSSTRYSIQCHNYTCA